MSKQWDYVIGDIVSCVLLIALILIFNQSDPVRIIIYFFVGRTIPRLFAIVRDQ